MKSELCEKEADYRLSLDLDVQGLGVCEQHREVMRYAYQLLMFMGKKTTWLLLKSLRVQKYRSRKKDTLVCLGRGVLVYWVHAKVCSSVFSKRNFV